jgi:hypothetical protein
MEEQSRCFDNLSRYSVLGFGVAGAVSLIFAKRVSRFNYMTFGLGIGAGYGAFECSPTLFDWIPDITMPKSFMEFGTAEAAPDKPTETTFFTPEATPEPDTKPTDPFAVAVEQMESVVKE